jgi:hypothetical protein
MTSKQLKYVLESLCSELGVCLPSEAQARFLTAEPGDLDSFTEKVIQAEGLDRLASSNPKLRIDIRRVILRHFKSPEEQDFAN